MDTAFEKINQKILHVKHVVEKQSSNIVVLLVINTDKRADISNDYKDFSVKSEYFSELELEEIINGFQNLGCKVDFSNGEKEFNEKLVNNYFRKYDPMKKIVYHSTGG